MVRDDGAVAGRDLVRRPVPDRELARPHPSVRLEEDLHGGARPAVVRAQLHAVGVRDLPAGAADGGVVERARSPGVVRRVRVERHVHPVARRHLVDVHSVDGDPVGLGGVDLLVEEEGDRAALALLGDHAVLRVDGRRGSRGVDRGDGGRGGGGVDGRGGTQHARESGHGSGSADEVADVEVFQGPAPLLGPTCAGHSEPCCPEIFDWINDDFHE